MAFLKKNVSLNREAVRICLILSFYLTTMIRRFNAIFCLSFVFHRCTHSFSFSTVNSNTAISPLEAPILLVKRYGLEVMTYFVVTHFENHPDIIELSFKLCLTVYLLISYFE